ncbi:hypothetical protein D3C85_1632810 [compost metagenome]
MKQSVDHRGNNEQDHIRFAGAEVQYALSIEFLKQMKSRHTIQGLHHGEQRQGMHERSRRKYMLYMVQPERLLRRLEAS